MTDPTPTSQEYAGSNELANPTIYIETASATTSPDNANSGNAAYVIVAATLGVLILLSALFGRVIGSALGYVLDDLGGELSDDYDLLDPYDGFDDYGDDYGYGYDESDEVSVDDALSLSLAPYTETIDNDLAATEYSGVPGDVRDWVRDIVKTDRSYNDQVIDALNAAARDSSTQKDNLQAALDACDAAISDYSGRQVPEFDVTDPSDTANDAHAALDDVVNRWHSVKEELTLLKDAADANEDIDYNSLSDADDKVVLYTQDAADSLDTMLLDAVAD